MKEMINEVFTALQGLDIKATPHNVSILNGVYAVLREIYNNPEVEEHGRRAADPGGQDDH